MKQRGLAEVSFHAKGSSEVSDSKWPLAIRFEMLPGDTVMERFTHAAVFGFDAVELPGRYLPSYKEELLSCRTKLPLPVSSLSLGFRGSLISADSRARRRCREDTRKLLDLCATLGARGLVMPPVLHADKQRRVGEARADGDASRQYEDTLLLKQLPELADYAHRNEVLLLLEPVNRFETDHLNTIGHAVCLCEQLQHPGLGIVADLFHMQIEELHPMKALRQAKNWLKHVHVAENTRVEPGPGSMDFGGLFKALREIGYKGYLVVECRALSGKAAEVLPRSVEYLRQLMDGLAC